MDIIKASDVRYSYAGEQNVTLALCRLTMTVKKGEFVAIVGHNGSGKSTYAKHINALFMPDAGSVVVDGMDTSDEKNVWEIRKCAGMVFQNPDNQMVATIVEEDVAFGPENIGVPPDEIRRRVDEALEIVDMSEYKERAPHMLSGGQKQRVAIAGVLAMHPKIIVFDEPTAMLDPEGRAEVMDTAKLLNAQGKTIVFITHYMQEALVADRVFVMKDGRILASGTPKQIFDDQKMLKEAGISAPPHIELYHRLKNEGFDVGECPLTIDELVKNLKICRKAKPKKDVPQKKRTVSDMSIEVKNLKYTYMKGTPFEAIALDDISVKIEAGEFVGIIGHTGSGKTTLIGLIAGLLKPMQGKVLVDGKDINEKKFDRKELRRHVGVVFQYPEHQLFEETVYKDIAFGPKKAGISEQETDKKVRRAMELMEIDFDTLKDLSPFELSGGQKRRVAIAGVIAMEPEVLILDEPVAGLDPLGRRHLMKLINHLNSEGKTIIMITHSMDDLAENAHRVLVMNKAKISMDDVPSKVYGRAKQLRDIGLDVPCVAKIANKLRSKGFEMSKSVIKLCDLEAELKYMMDKKGIADEAIKAGECLD